MLQCGVLQARLSLRALLKASSLQHAPLPQDFVRLIQLGSKLCQRLPCLSESLSEGHGSGGLCI